MTFDTCHHYSVTSLLKDVYINAQCICWCFNTKVHKFMAINPLLKEWFTCFQNIFFRFDWWNFFVHFHVISYFIHHFDWQVIHIFVNSMFTKTNKQCIQETKSIAMNNNFQLNHWHLTFFLKYMAQTFLVSLKLWKDRILTGLVTFQVIMVNIHCMLC